MSLDVKRLGQDVHRLFVGVHLNTDKVKPVHIANGLFRTLLERPPPRRVVPVLSCTREKW